MRELVLANPTAERRGLHALAQQSCAYKSFAFVRKTVGFARGRLLLFIVTSVAKDPRRPNERLQIRPEWSNLQALVQGGMV